MLRPDAGRNAGADGLMVVARTGSPPGAFAVPSPFPLQPRPEIDALMGSQIREVANAGIGRSDILPFWFGEPDQVTPSSFGRRRFGH